MRTSSIDSLPPVNGDTPGDRLFGAGEMAELIRLHDWAATPLGAIADWSAELVGAVNQLLNSPFPYALFWGAACVMLYNDAYRPIVGRSHPEALGQPGAVCWSDSWDLVGPEFERVLATGEKISRENVLIPNQKSGRWENLYWTYSLGPVYAQGRVIGVFNVAQDQTDAVLGARERERLLVELDAKYMELRAVYETSSVALAMIDPVEFRYLRGNSKLAEILGQPIEKVIGTRVFDLANDVAGLGDALRKAADGIPVMGLMIEGELSNMPGVHRQWQAEYLPIFGKDGRVKTIAASSIETTAQRQMQAALVQNEKLAAVGRLAASIAHEINNPLEAVTNLLYLARLSEEMAEAQRYIEDAEKELRRVSVISNQTLRFHRQSTRPRLAPCADLMGDVLSIYHGRLASAHVAVEERQHCERPLLCFEGEIRQVVSNLVGNALDAMVPAGGQLLLRSREARRWRDGAAGLAITVADTGAGMSAKTLANLFEPFYTTKDFAGTGLGLWISKAIVERHKGTLRVRSSQRPGRTGTVFVLFLPFDGVEVD